MEYTNINDIYLSNIKQNNPMSNRKMPKLKIGDIWIDDIDSKHTIVGFDCRKCGHNKEEMLCYVFDTKYTYPCWSLDKHLDSDSNK